jgi:hypothetical protein
MAFINPQMPLPAEYIQSTVTHGSPGLVRAFGRAFGLGQAEQTALAAGAVPWWLWVTFGVGVGVIAGVQLQKRAPGYASYVGGGR